MVIVDAAWRPPFFRPSNRFFAGRCPRQTRRTQNSCKLSNTELYSSNSKRYNYKILNGIFCASIFLLFSINSHISPVDWASSQGFSLTVIDQFRIRSTLFWVEALHTPCATRIQYRSIYARCPVPTPTWFPGCSTLSHVFVIFRYRN